MSPTKLLYKRGKRCPPREKSSFLLDQPLLGDIKGIHRISSSIFHDSPPHKKKRFSDPSPEEFCLSKYANIALDMYLDQVGVEFELVDIGPQVVANLTKGQIIHINFDAKRKNDPQARVQTFFAELSKSGSDDLVADICHRFGRTDSLKDTADFTCCCLYCSDYPVRHPLDGIYHNGLSRRVNNIFKHQKLLMLKREAEDENVSVGVSDFGKLAEELAYVALRNTLEGEDEDEDYEVIKVDRLKEAVMLDGSGKIWHMNFDAKLKGDHYAPVEMFFAELIKTYDNDAITTKICISFGPIDSLPDYCAPNGCCLYCCDDPIFHPQITDYHNGRECQTLSDIIKNQKEFKPKNETAFGNLGPSDFEGLEIECGSLSSNVLYAAFALKVYNEENGTNFKLLRTCCKGAVQLRLGCVIHLNFEAINQDDHDAQFQMFFTEVIRKFGSICVDYCYCLGDTDSISDDANYVHDCSYCIRGVLHPPAFGYLTGCETWPYS